VQREVQRGVQVEKEVRKNHVYARDVHARDLYVAQAEHLQRAYKCLPNKKWWFTHLPPLNTRSFAGAVCVQGRE